MHKLFYRTNSQRRYFTRVNKVNNILVVNKKYG